MKHSLAFLDTAAEVAKYSRERWGYFEQVNKQIPLVVMVPVARSSLNVLKPKDLKPSFFKLLTKSVATNYKPIYITRDSRGLDVTYESFHRTIALGHVSLGILSCTAASERQLKYQYVIDDVFIQYPEDTELAEAALQFSGAMITMLAKTV